MFNVSFDQCYESFWKQVLISWKKVTTLNCVIVVLHVIKIAKVPNTMKIIYCIIYKNVDLLYKDFPKLSNTL